MLSGVDETVGFILGMPFLIQVEAELDICRQTIKTSFGTFGFGGNKKVGEGPLPKDAVTRCMTVLTEAETDPIDVALRDNILSEHGITMVRQLLEEYSEVWTPGSLGSAADFAHLFVLTDNRPVVLPPRVIPTKWHPEIEKQEDEMREKGVIEPSNSPYRFYPVLAQKKDGTQRFAIDYRRLNQITVPDKYPMPRIEDLFAAIKQSGFFTLLDLASGFWQIPLDENQRHFTAFSTH